MDDDQQFLVLLTRVLEAAGYCVVSTNDARNALSLATSAPFDLVIADYEMPDMNGAELAGQIKQHKCQLPIILFSGNPSLPAEVLSTVDDYLFKGAGAQLLLQTLERRFVTVNDLPIKETEGHLP